MVRTTNVLLKQACRVRGYDVEVHRARCELQIQGVDDITAILPQPSAMQCVQRRHIPEDFKQKRYHVGRYQSAQPSPGNRNVDDLLHGEKWMKHSTPEALRDWS
eukprot:m.77569 g.77569  ORF g.77569 m.77569 type:complete len:104 (+) comp16204_c0_seq2:6374-6685(+)